MLSLNSQKEIDSRFAQLQLANNGGRPSNSTRPTTSAAPRVATINFYNQALAEEPQPSRPSHEHMVPGLENYQIGKGIG
jgi:hypothetical protein